MNRDHSSKLLSSVRKSRFYVRILATDRQTNRQTDKQTSEQTNRTNASGVSDTTDSPVIHRKVHVSHSLSTSQHSCADRLHTILSSFAEICVQPKIYSRDCRTAYCRFRKFHNDRCNRFS